MNIYKTPCFNIKIDSVVVANIFLKIIITYNNGLDSGIQFIVNQELKEFKTFM